MAYFEWAVDMEIDHGPIDEDHKRLVDLVNALHSATSAGRGHEVVGGILDDLVRYTSEHLRREEALMTQIHYPDLAGHKKGHDRFVADLEHLKQRYLEGRITVAAQLSSVLRDWLSLHIRRNDKEFLQYLRKKAG